MSVSYYMVTLLLIDIFTDTSNSDVSPPTVCVSMPFPVASEVHAYMMPLSEAASCMLQTPHKLPSVQVGKLLGD